MMEVWKKSPDTIIKKIKKIKKEKIN